MPVTFDPVGDFVQVVDGLQAVTLTDRNSRDVRVDNALRRAVSRKEAEASNGFYTTADVHWHLPQEEAEDEPAVGGTITDGDYNEWTILAVGNQTLGDRWRCTCRNLVITERLDTLVTIQIAELAIGDSGAHEQTWSDLLKGVRGRLQRVNADATPRIGTLHMHQQYKLFLRERVPLNTRHRIVDSAGNRYRVVGYRDPERIDKLSEVDLAPWTETYLTGGIG